MAIASEIVFLYFTLQPFNIGLCLSIVTPFFFLMLTWFLILKLLEIQKKTPSMNIGRDWFSFSYRLNLQNYSAESSYLSLEFISAIRWGAGNISTASETGALLFSRSFRLWALRLNSTCKFDDKRALRNYKRVVEIKFFILNLSTN